MKKLANTPALATYLDRELLSSNLNNSVELTMLQNYYVIIPLTLAQWLNNL